MPIRSVWLRYVLAVLSAFVATGIQIAIGNTVGYLYVFQALYLAVLFSAWIGGFGPALASLGISAVLGAIYLLAPRGSFSIAAPQDRVGWILFVFTSLCIALLGAKMRNAQSDAERNARRLRDQAERLRITLASIGDAVIVTDSRGNVRLMNAAAEELTGWSLEDARGKPLMDVFRIVNELTRHPVESPAERAAREGAVVGLANHTLLLARDGKERPIDDSAAPIRNEGGPIIGVVLVFRDVSSRRQAERRVLAQDERLRSALEAGRMGTWEWELATNRVTWSAELERMHELEPGTFPGTFAGFEKHLHPDDRQRVHALIEETLRTENDYRVEYRILLADETVRWMEARGRLICDADGTPQRMSGVCMDITQRKESEKQIYLHANVLESMMEGVMLCNHAGLIWYTNPAMQRMFGYGPGELVGQHVSILNAYPPEENERIVTQVIKHLETHRTWQGEFLNRRKDGWQFTTYARVSALEYGGESHWLSVQEDISERKRHEEDLQFLAEASRSLSTSLDYEQTLERIARIAVPRFADWCVVHIADPSGALRQIAVAHADPTKVAFAEEFALRYPPDPQSNLGVGHVLRTGKSVLIEAITAPMLKLAARDEDHLRVLRELKLGSYLAVPLRLADRTIGVMSFLSDESRRRFTLRDVAVAEDLARRAAKAIENAQLYARLHEEHRRKDEFLAMLAHELRNPLAPIRSGLELLALSGVEHETIPMMREQIAHLVRLVDDLLDVSRIVQGKIRLHQKPVELCELVRHTFEAARPLMASQNQHLELSVPDQPVWIRGDEVRLAQCLTNLLQNAAKYTEPEGRVWVTLHQDGDFAELAVEDDGIGIEADLLPHIFELFTQADRSLERSKGGLGIGLTVVRNLIEAQGGTITVHSEGLGQGSEFVMRFPICEPESAPELPVDKDGEIAGRRVLIVDDNTGAARILGMLLETAGPHEIEYAYDGASALEVARNFQPEIVLLDIGLPGKSGYDVVEELRAGGRFEDALIVALTGYGTDEDRRRSLQAGFDEHLVKPPSLDMLAELFNHPKLHRVASGANTASRRA